MMRGRKWAIVGAAVAGVAAAGATAFIVHEKHTEQPPYTVEARDGPIELRRYPALLVAETETLGARDAALGSGFSRLAEYIFARNRPGGTVAMTAPVLSERSGATWRTRFVMPAKYRRDTLPPPGPGVTLATLPARRVAAYRFSGTATDAALTKAEAALRAWLATRGLQAGAVTYAYYNSPFMPGPLRRNEVMITVAS
jgi:hypothetical protein